MNLPNRLTALRMLLAPVYLAFMFLPLPHRYLWAALLFAVAAATDFLDGRLARKYQQVTVLGQLTDPVADKMLTTAALLAFLRLGWCGIWIVMLVLTREFLITSVRLIAGAQGVVIPANFWGKLKTVSQMVFTMAVMLLAEARESLNWFAEGARISFHFVSNGMLWITAVLAVLSGAIYLAEAYKIIDFSEKRKDGQA
ncbi:MAG: CDP-diacylglycerol--glycerol-3-phosphate 3-phosphatidyltransferase [Oscillospiraceae bacterium]|nr:CDP-diacylglycerol--glycerol-3-phosphate 3-phosphatidyltransferase [Oscillospiraceae bacterium]